MQLGKLSPAENGRGINLPDMPSTRPPVGVIQAGNGVFPLDGQQNDGHKHPIIDTVQTVTTYAGNFLLEPAREYINDGLVQVRYFKDFSQPYRKSTPIAFADLLQPLPTTRFQTS
ncbi:uncharacterized protein LOC119766402 [Culex quinquefasciatus]|uniref:uncharacterized protein LOC119766402 n=1 Tax=Culex quinquefasciatus TaxID=7176 RepID=UPI0018E33BF4|nr:uncharacterized protein LOC119766402 [Culex quinquefasciatus]